MQAQTRKINIITTLNQAWHSIKGSKSSIWLVTIIMAIIVIIVNTLSYYLFHIDIKEQPSWTRLIVVPIITNAIIAPFYAGAVLCALRQVRGEKISLSCGFQYFNYYLPLAIALAIIGFLGSLGIIIVNAPQINTALGHYKSWADILAGIYSMIVYTFFILTIPLIVDKEETPFGAMRRSIETIKPHFVSVFVILIIVYFLLVLFSIPMVIGFGLLNSIVMAIGLAIFLIALVWVIPWLFMIVATIYHQLIDTEEVEVQRPPV